MSTAILAHITALVVTANVVIANIAQAPVACSRVFKGSHERRIIACEGEGSTRAAASCNFGGRSRLLCSGCTFAIVVSADVASHIWFAGRSALCDALNSKVGLQISGYPARAAQQAASRRCTQHKRYT